MKYLLTLALGMFLATAAPAVARQHFGGGTYASGSFYALESIAQAAWKIAYWQEREARKVCP